MSFTDDFLTSLEKEKKKTAEKKKKKTVTAGNSFTQEFLSKTDDDIAPVKTSTPQLLLPVRTGVQPTANTVTAPVRTTTKAKDDSRKWFDKGLFDDGYQFGDVTKTILGTAGDAAIGVVKGIGYMGEGVADLVSYGVAGAVDALGRPVTADAIRERTAKSATDLIFGGLEKATDKYSVLGDKSDSVTQGIGQVATILATGGLAGAAGLGAVGTTALTTGLMGASSAGSGMGEAYLGGATDEEAATYGLIKGVVDAGSELIFGGLGKAVKAVGLSKGLTSVDDMLAKKLSGKITNHIAKNFVEYGVKASAEGVEEVIAGVGSAMAKQATYMSDKELGELLADENLMEQFVVGAVTSGIAQSGIVPGMKIGSLAEANKTGRDFITGLSTNEQAVVDKVYENSIAEAEKDGKKLTTKEKNKLYDSVVEDMDKGRISIDTIEEVLGGDTYKSYRETVDSEDALNKEFEELGNKQNATLAEQSRYNELKQQLEDMKQNSQRDTLKTKLGEEVFGLAKDSRLAESYAERDRRGQAFEADLTQYDVKQQEVVKRAAESGILNNTRRTHEFVDLVSKISADKGVLFDFTNNEKLKESGFAVSGKTVDGYVTKDGITLNMDSPKAWQTTVGHEITHVLEGTELYDSLRTTIFEYAKSKGEYDSRLADIQERYKGIENADYEAELTSDLVGDYLFADENFIKHLSVNNRNVFQKIYDEVKYMLKVVTAGSKEARQLEKVKRAFDKVYKESGKQTEAKTEDVSASDTKYSVSVTDKETIDFLENQEHITTYKAMQVIDGKLYPPMAAKVKDENGRYQLTNPSQLGKWQQATEDPSNIKKMKNGVGYYTLNKGDGTSIDAAYNPYEHSSNLVLNDQFESAHRRDNLVVVECVIPVSEMSSGYKAQYAKDGTGVMDWKSGVVAGKIKDNKRQVYLSRYLKPVRILSDAEVAGKYKEILDGTGVSVPFNVVQPSLLAELEKAGVAIDYEGSPMYKANQKRAAEKAKYSVSDSDGKKLSKEQQEYFKDSKMRDENGNLKVMYHGSQDAGFHVFDARMSDDDTSFFFVDRNDVAASYSGTTETYEAKTIRTAEDMNNFLAEIGYDHYEVVEKNGEFELLENNEHVAYSDTAQGIYEEFCWYEGVGEGDANYKVYLNLTNPLVVDAEGRNWNNLTGWSKAANLKAEDATVKRVGDEFRLYKNGQEVENASIVVNQHNQNMDTEVLKSIMVNKVNNILAIATEGKTTTREIAKWAKEQGYDGVIFKNIVDNGGYSNGSEGASTVAIAFDSNQIKSVANEKPTADKDIRFSLSDGKVHGKGVPLRDLRLKTQEETQVESEENFTSAPVSEEVSQVEEVAPVAENATIPSSPSALADIAKQGRRENMRGAYTHNGKQYLSDGSFIAEFNTVDESLEQSGDFPIKQAIKELDEAFARQVDGKYDLHTSDTQGFVKVGKSLFGTKRVNALIRALENPVFSLANVHGGHEALVVTADNGRAVLMPVRASGNAYLVYEAQPIAEAATFTDDFAPATEDEANAIRTEAFQTVDDGDMPPEMEAPYQPRQEVTVDDPFEDRDWYEVGNRKVKAYMYENPEVKPFFQEEAAVMLDELNSTTKGERWYDDNVYYDSGGEAGWGGTKRHTSDSIAEMLDGWKMSYDDIEKGLKAIIEDHGAENIAAAKKIEFMLNERLLNGYTSFVGWEPTMDKWGNVPPNQSYLAMLNEKQVTEYSKEAFDALMAEADRYAPVGISETETTTPVAIAENATTTDDIAPVAPAYEVVSDKKGDIKGQQAITKEDAATGKTAKILVEEPEVEKKQSVWSKFKNLVLDKGMVFEDLSIRTGNRELQARWNSIRYARNKAQRLMEKGNASVSSLDSIRKTVEGKGKEYTQKFYEYLYHMHNIDRMSLETAENRVKREGLQVQFQGYTDEQLSDLATSWITKDTPQETVDRIKAAREYVDAKKNGNKPVFGDDVTAEISRKTVSEMEKANPEFKEYAQEVYGYMKYLREMLVDNGVISKETAKLWDEMYPHYVPIRRLGDTGLNINVPLDTGRTGVNAPVKRATGGSRDILPLFDTIGQRTMQTYSAVAKNRFGVELKNTLGTTIGSEAMGLDEAIDSIDAQDGLLQEGKKGKKPTFTVFEDGKRVTFEITDEMYDAMKPTSDALSYTNKVASAVSDFRRNTLTQYNPWFMLKNAIKDVQDVLVNSQHAARTYATIPKAIYQMVSNGQWYTEYMENGGEDNSYFDSQSNTFKKPNPTIEAIKKYTGLNAIAKANNIIERLPRLAEYIASREAGRSVDVAMLDAARVTTNFAAGGDLTKFLNRNGATFLNASFQGAMQQVRNVREAKAAGVKGVLNLAAKFVVAGLPAIALNALVWGDDEEYEELSDYVKQSYYIVGKTEDGKFIRIPKGRTVAVIQNGFEQMQHLITGDDEADLGTFLDLLLTNLAPNNPLDNNILSPIIDVAQNKTWYGEDLVPTRLQDVPNAEQYDESTDSLSKWLGEVTADTPLEISPYKANYLLDQYGGIISDTFLPMLTPEAESGNDTFVGNMIAPLKDMFTTDSVMNNQNVSDFYDTKDELTKAANSMYATDDDVLKAKYMNSINSEMGKLYGEKRELQNSDMPDAEKYEAVREVQRQIDELAKSGLATYNDVLVSGGYATVGDRHYRKKDGEWSKITEEQLAKQEEVTSGLGISPADYWSNKEEYDFAYEKPEKYAVAKAVGGYDSYKTYSSELYDIKADKDENGDSIRNSRKEKVIDWVNNLDADYGTRIILFKNEYNADDTYNYDIIDYLNNRDDISYDDMVAILKELGFDVDANGNISWD